MNKLPEPKKKRARQKTVKSRSKVGQKRKPLTTVRQRKLKRRDKAATESEQIAKDEFQKSKVHWDGGRADQLLLRRAQRWQTNLTATQASESLAPEHRDELPIKQLAMVIVRKGLLHDDMRVNQHAVTNLLRAEQQNQADEHKVQPDKVDMTVNISPEERVENVLSRIRSEITRQTASRHAADNGSK